MRKVMPEVSLRAELGMPDRLTRLLIEGVTEKALFYTPQARPGLELEQIVEEELVLVASWPEPGMDLAGCGLRRRCRAGHDHRGTGRNCRGW